MTQVENDSNETPMTEAEIAKFKTFAAQIAGSDMLGKLLNQSSPGNRHQMYVSLLPYLQFKPRPYWWFAKRVKKVRRVA